MATPIVMPRLGDFMTEGTVVRLARSQGDQVGRGEVIAEIETEKLNYDLEAVAGGIFHPVVVEGATVAVDGLIAYVLRGGRESSRTGDATSAVCADQRSSGPGAPSRRRERRGWRIPLDSRRSRGRCQSRTWTSRRSRPPAPEAGSSRPTFAHSPSSSPPPRPSYLLLPAARRLASSLGVDLSQVTPTGPSRSDRRS